MEYWWVNQNQTYQFEVPGGYMWSPKTNTNGARNQSLSLATPSTHHNQNSPAIHSWRISYATVVLVTTHNMTQFSYLLQLCA